MRGVERRPDHGADAVDPVVEQALAQHTLPDHAGRAEEEHVHGTTLPVEPVYGGVHHQTTAQVHGEVGHPGAAAELTVRHT
ncbi:hypothetical protein GCM10009664_26860 [Kitasatospora gansuensis]